MVKDIPFFVFCYKFYLIIKKIKAKFLVGENEYMCGYCKLYETLTLNAIPTCRVPSKYPICNLGGAFEWRPRPKCNTWMQVHFEII